jgi:hypothetical protein
MDLEEDEKNSARQKCTTASVPSLVDHGLAAACRKVPLPTRMEWLDDCGSVRASICLRLGCAVYLQGRDKVANAPDDKVTKAQQRNWLKEALLVNSGIRDFASRPDQDVNVQEY